MQRAFTTVLLIHIAAAAAFAEHTEAPLAIVGVTLHEAGQPVVADAAIVIVEGRIVAAGADLDIAPEADRLDATGLHAYPGFIDAWSSLGISEKKRSEEERAWFEDENPDTSQGPLAATRLANRRGILPQWRADEQYAPSDGDLAKHRAHGFTAALSGPRGGLLGGQSALVSLTDLPRRRAVLSSGFAQHASFSPEEPGRYPRTSLGAIASLRQFFYDVHWYRELLKRPREFAPAGRVPVDPALAAGIDVAVGAQLLVFEAQSEQEVLRALRLAEEFDLRIWISGGKEAHKVADLLKERDVPVIATLDFEKKPEEPTHEFGGVRTYYEPKRLREERLRLWYEQVDNVRVLLEAGVEVALSTRGVENLKEFHEHLREAIEHGLDVEGALAALTRTPARLLGMQRALGTLSPGALGNVVLYDKPFEEKKSVVRYVFVEGRRFEFEEKKDKKDKGQKEEDKPDPDEPTSDVADVDTTGQVEIDTNGTSDTDTNGPDEEQEEKSKKSEPAEPNWRVELEADRKPSLQTGGDVFIRGATVLPVSGPAMAQTSVLVRGGKIAAVGAELTPPEGTRVIEGDGLFVMPGIIDCHSHMALGSINEGTQSVTAEVRVGDVIDHRQVAIYRALAGGVTTIHTMHGSANTIGGECVVLKLRYGKRPDEMRFAGAPRTLKFALGENVTHMNASPRGDRFPHTRMGVESVLRQALTAAEEYRAKRTAAAAADALPVRRDLRLETLAEVLSGDVWVHCHGYRADEYLRLVDVAETFGFRIAVMQHCLEGYRIMPEIAWHGCGVSTFASDWAYKIEAYSGIPYNAAMLTRAGVNVSVNSDSASTIRYMNQEAAKSVRWGGLDMQESLALITLNPAQQLGIADRVGAIDVGKDADLAIFDGHPLDSFSRCVYTLVDGEIYFADPDAQRAAPPAPVQPAPQAPQAIARNDRGVYLLSGATVHPVSADAIAGGAVLIRDGRIAAVGTEIAAPDGATVVDLKGAHVWPGLIDAGTELGLAEIGAAQQTRDAREIAEIQPELRALAAVHPHSAHVAIGRAAGMTTALTRPTGGHISGTSAIVDLAGWTMPEMLRVSDFALHMAVPSLPLHLTGERAKERREAHEKDVKEIEDFLRRAKSYRRWHEAAADSRPPRDMRLEAMAPFLAGEKPVVFRAQTHKEILDTLEFAKKHELRPIIYGGREAWKCADILAERAAPVILATVWTYPRGDFEPFDSVFACAAELERAGVRFCFASDSAASMFDLPFQVGTAVAYGLSPERAMHALTLGAAEVLGVDDEIGSLEVGKVANVIVTSDLPIQATAGTSHVFIRGEPIGLENLHTQQRDRFASRPQPDLPAQRPLAGPPALTRTTETQP
jgi:imidazolonepropionase-like amidohydrolase